MGSYHATISRNKIRITPMACHCSTAQRTCVQGNPNSNLNLVYLIPLAESTCVSEKFKGEETETTSAAKISDENNATGCCFHRTEFQGICVLCSVAAGNIGPPSQAQCAGFFYDDDSCETKPCGIPDFPFRLPRCHKRQVKPIKKSCTPSYRHHHQITGNGSDKHVVVQ